MRDEVCVFCFFFVKSVKFYLKVFCNNRFWPQQGYSLNGQMSFIKHNQSWI